MYNLLVVEQNQNVSNMANEHISEKFFDVQISLEVGIEACQSAGGGDRAMNFCAHEAEKQERVSNELFCEQRDKKRDEIEANSDFSLNTFHE